MSSAEERVRTLFDVVGLPVGDEELRAIAADYPTLREQANALHRTAADGVVVSVLTPSEFPSAGSARVSSSDAPATTIRDAALSLREGKASAVELVTDVFARIDRLDGQLGAYVSTFRATALEAAARADDELTAGHDRGPLHGIPLAIKDVIATVEAPTRANSRVAPSNWRDDQESTAVARLRDAGAIIVGKTTTSEFGLGLNEPSQGFPTPRNPWDTTRFAGGSSSGNAIAVASGLALGGLASDTGGSIRHPVALNGVTGLKPSFGRVPTGGLVPLARTLDTVGPIARSAWDCALLLQAIAGHDEDDLQSSGQPVPAYLDEMDGSVRGIRIGWPARYFFDAGNVADAVKIGVLEAIGVLREAGATVSEVSLPGADIAKVANHIVLLTEGLAYHRDALISQWAEYGTSLRGLLARGALFAATDYVQAKKIATAFGREVAEAMRGCDVLIVPTMPTGARLIEETDPAMMDRWSRASFTSQWNLIGLPVCALPVGFDGYGMPVSMQIVGRPFDEATVLRLADGFQRVTDFHLATPPEPYS